MKKNLFNKFWLRVGMLVAVMTTALAGTVWAAEESVTFSEQNYVNNETIDEYVGTAFSITFDKGTNSSNAPKYFTSGTAIRCYGGNYFIVTSSYTITKIVISFGNGDGSNKITTDVGTYTNGTWTGSASSVKFTIGGSTGNRRIDGVTVTYSTGGSSAVETTTTIDATSITNTDVYAGTAAGSLSATVTANGSAVSGATVAWSSSDEDVATIDADGAVTLVGAGTVTFTATYAGVANTYQSSSATYEMTVTSSAPYVQPTEIEIALNDNFFGTNYGGSAAGITDDTPISGTKDNVTITYAGGGNHYVNDSQIRFYPNNKLTFDAPEGYEIKSIVFTSAGTWSATISADNGTYNSSSKTWTGSESSVLFTGSGSSRCDMSKATITIGLPSTDPSISASDVNIAYNATSGSINYTISNPVEGTSLTASTTANANWISNFVVGESAVTFTATANEATESRSATVTLTYGSVTKEVTVTQAAAPVIYTTIPALFEKATEVGSTATDVNVTFNNWVVSAISTNGKNVFVTDNAGNGFIIYDTNGGLNNTYSVGNILSGTAVACKVQKFNGSAEVTGLNASDLTITTGGSVTTANVAMASLAGVNTGALVSYENLTCSVDDSGSTTKYYLTDGTTSIQVYNSLFAFGALEAGKVYNITGVYQQFNSTKEILPRSAADIEEVEAPVQTTVTAGTLSHVEISSLYDGDMEDITLGDNVAVGTLVYFSLSVTEGYTLESVTVLDASNNEVTLTETQGAWSFYMPNSSVTINATAVQGSVTPVTGDKYVKVTSTDDLTDGQYLIVYEEGSVAFNGGLEELDAASNTISVTISNNEIAADETTEAAEVTIAAMEDGYSICSASGLYIYHTGSKNTLNTSEEAQANIITFNDGNVSITVGDYSLYFNSALGQERFRYYNKTGQQAIQLYKKVEEVPTSQTVTVSPAGYATIVAAANLEIPTGVEVYAAKVNEGATSAQLTAVTDGIPAGAAVLVKASAGTYEFTYTTETVAEITNNDLVAATAAVTADGSQYCLAQFDGVGFYKVQAGIVIPAGKAYLQVTSSAGQAKAFYGFDDDATGIETIDNGQLTTDNGVIYNLAGQRLQKMQRGINIVNGKKILK
ncbi:MAG: BACON domain-containing protein [Bacteroidaceae bacterium]|nr:BACON domain-containing protein [Bacteroidaceae bacterium]